MKSSGFTLIEAMVTVAILAIVVALALPSFQDSVRKSHRAEAEKDLMGFAGTAAQVFTELNSYLTLDDVDGDGDPLFEPEDNAFYVYTTAVAATTYTITATPTAAQNAEKCGTMTLSNTGAKTNSTGDAKCLWK